MNNVIDLESRRHPYIGRMVWMCDCGSTDHEFHVQRGSKALLVCAECREETPVESLLEAHQ